MSSFGCLVSLDYVYLELFIHPLVACVSGDSPPLVDTHAVASKLYLARFLDVAGLLFVTACATRVALVLSLSSPCGITESVPVIAPGCGKEASALVG